MGEFDWALYSRGTYWLYEIWNKEETNIVAKGKWESRESLKKSIGDELTDEILDKAQHEGQAYVGKDGLKRFVKFVDLA